MLHPFQFFVPEKRGKRYGHSLVARSVDFSFSGNFNRL
jgi:hypothetical protein